MPYQYVECQDAPAKRRIFSVKYAANPVDTTNSSHLSPAIRRGCQITDADIVAVANNCPNLATLNVEYVV